MGARPQASRMQLRLINKMECKVKGKRTRFTNKQYTFITKRNISIFLTSQAYADTY